MSQLIVLLAVEVAGLAAIWFALRARLRRALETEQLVAEARREIRSLAIELNETADRNITLIEDRLESLRSLLEEADRRMGLYRRESEARFAEREVYTQLGRPRPAPTSPRSASEPPSRSAPEPSPRPAPLRSPRADSSGTPPSAVVAPLQSPEIVPLRPGSIAPAPIEAATSAWVEDPREPTEEPVRLELGRRLPEVASRESVIPPRPLREQALELHRKGFSAEVIAARLGASISEIELLVSLEEGRSVGPEP